MKRNTTAVVFPGQGTQRFGMGKDFHDNIAASANTYEEASDILGLDVAGLCFGTDEKIHLTEYAQPCILATEIAMFRGICSKYGLKPDYFGGHSLGEYTALVAAGAIPFPEALKAVQARGRLMQQAVPPGTGKMAAVIADRLDVGLLQETLAGLPMDVANINSVNQVVISGRAESIETAQNRIRKRAGGDPSLRFVELTVSAPFHSRFMLAIRDAFREVLNAVSAKLNPENARRVTSNSTGGFHSGNAARIVDELVRQISSAVNWRENMRVLSEKAQDIYEIGPNRPLKNFFMSIGIPCRSITTFPAARRVFAEEMAQ